MCGVLRIVPVLLPVLVTMITYSAVTQGSINLAFESERMAIPKAKFIGLSSADPDALANKDFRYLTKTYLPRKLKEEDWLD